MRVEEGFQLTPFTEGNAFTSDPALPGLLKRILPDRVLSEVLPDLVRLGGEAVTSVRATADRAAPPTLTQYNQWGHRIDRLETSEAWGQLKGIFFREGIPGIFYERKYGEFSRVYGFAKLHLLVGDSQVVGCPLSMTDGCARVIELLGTPEMKRDIFPRLTSRDPSFAFTSGQWMTERPGGSDVSLTETTAIPTKNAVDAMWPEYKLDGLKWFSSATDSNVSVALARTGDIKDGSRSLSLFLVPLRLPLIPDPNKPLPSPLTNGIFTHRLKNKVGTNIVPTAELSLQFTSAYLLGSQNQGVKNIIPVLNITRVHSALSSTAYLRKGLAIAVSYSRVRAIHNGTQLLQDNPLHVAQLASISLVYRAMTHLTFGTILLMGKLEVYTASVEEKHLFRIMTAVAKGFVAEKACAALEECMTTLGGMGYMEEVGIGRLIRDGLVEKIWEGTVTVLAMDVVRTAKDPATFIAFASWAKRIVDSCPTELKALLEKSLIALRRGIQQIQSVYGTTNMAPLVPRPAFLLLGYVSSSLFLLEHAVWSWRTNSTERDVDVEVFNRWVIEGGMSAAMDDVLRAIHGSTKERLVANSAITYGAKL
ncbi:hypothetical protein BJ138DRAFT_1165034 [Hygrophoropsis aurantiaca]|uniref:Uncharacterized protein n=1 Tax=Hygrophoropsis aurantiaca TaxID=72124 RepID=A0ACB7ZW79_9AGAM|nr:hypothetical protein BJ138DRAFT_1165034 [Hygrophoropsis aurantiaca]